MPVFPSHYFFSLIGKTQKKTSIFLSEFYTFFLIFVLFSYTFFFFILWKIFHANRPRRLVMTIQELVQRHADTVYTLFGSLFGTIPSISILMEMTGTPEILWARDFPFSGKEQGPLPHRISLTQCFIAIPGAAALFSRLSKDTDKLFGCLRLAALDRELEAVEALIDTATNLKHNVSPATINALTLLSMRTLLNVPIPPHDPGPAQRYMNMCMGFFKLAITAGCHIPRPALVFFRARGFMHILGDKRGEAFSELLIGAMNMCNHDGHNNLRHHRLMRHGREVLLARDDAEDLLRAAPFLGIYAFIEGSYAEALRQFHLAIDQMRQDHEDIMELFCLRHLCFSAFNLGLFEYAEHQLQSRLRQYAPRSDNQLARTIRGQLAGCLLRTGNLDAALEHLDTAQFGISPSHDIVSWITNNRQLSYYHLLRGNLENAYHVLHSALGEAEKQHYARPLYLSCVLLEQLAFFHRAGYPPLPCYSLEEEMERCLNGPNNLLRGIALRLQGDLAMETAPEKAALAYRESIHVLRNISALELSKSYIRASLLSLRTGKRKKAYLYALYAWPHHEYLHHLWPTEVEALIPDDLRNSGRNGLTSENLIRKYHEHLSAIPPSPAFSTFAINLTMSSCHVLGAQYGFLFFMGDEDEGPRLLASVGPDGVSDPGSRATAMRDFVHLVREDSPQIMDKFFNAMHPGDSGRMMVGIPLESPGGGFYVLCHDHLTDPAVRYVISTEMLGALGKLAGEALARNSMARLPEHHGVVASGGSTEIIYISPKIKTILDKVDLIADTDASVFISGESGSGKDLIARRIHENSGRTGEFICLNMAMLSSELMGSELFGHEKGAFTGAQNAKPGFIELADKGTLFLDEITECSPAVQAALLRVLENRTFYRVGGTRTLSADFRLVAASNRSLQEAVERGTFRRDLYYRISSITVNVPPLRERKEDISALAFYYLHYFAHRHRRVCVPKFSQENLHLLLGYSWPGNVRELKNVIESSVLLSSGQVIELPRHEPAPRPSVENGHPPLKEIPGNFESCMEGLPSLEEMEERYIRMVLSLTNGRINGPSGALSILKMNRSTLYARLRAYGLRQG